MLMPSPLEVRVNRLANMIVKLQKRTIRICMYKKISVNDGHSVLMQSQVASSYKLLINRVFCLGVASVIIDVSCNVQCSVMLPYVLLYACISQCVSCHLIFK